jgi:hypothetical protein
VKILSSKVPIAGRVCKESVKVCTPKSPPPANNPTFYLASLNILPHSARTQPQHLGGFLDRQ